MQTIPWQKIHVLEDEIKALKSLGKKQSKKVGQKTNLKGILKDIHITWKDFQEAKKIWFNESHLLYQKHKK